MSAWDLRGPLPALLALTMMLALVSWACGDGDESAAVKDTTASDDGNAPLELDPAKAATHLSKVADTPGVYWVRGMDMVWGEIETSPGAYDWSISDEMISASQQQDIYLLAMVKPFAGWDQETCHRDPAYDAALPRNGGAATIKVGSPCDMQAYGSFLRQLVERYDGDGTDDMPGLAIPVKYWEIMNEPSMQGGETGGMGEELKFFVGTPEEYLEILRTSYESIKEADPGAQVAHAGMAGMQPQFVAFWKPVFSGGGGEYFDIANIHAISVDEHRQDLFTISFRRLLEQYGLGDKPIWITEVQLGSLAERPEDTGAFEELLVKASVFSLAHGADKLFYIENWLFWDNPEMLAGPAPMGEEGPKEKPKPPLSSTQKVYLNLVSMINDFDSIEVLADDFQEKIVAGPAPDGGQGAGGAPEATSVIGQYGFKKGDRTVYVLWGEAPLPPQISGDVILTDIYGDSSRVAASSVRLSDVPVFIEVP